MANHTLLLRIAAPLQSWGSSSRFPDRKTDIAPTKSGIIGMVAAALGRKRDDSIDDLLNLGFAVRIEQEGNIESDSQNATQWERDTGKKNNTLPRSIRYYISDGVFLVALEGEKDKLEEIEYALKHPIFHLFLGRKSCPPSTPLVLGIKEKDKLSVLREEKWHASEWFKEKTGETTFLTIIRGGKVGESGDLVHDSPLSFSPLKRSYANRVVIMDTPVKVYNDTYKDTINHSPLDVFDSLKEKE